MVNSEKKVCELLDSYYELLKANEIDKYEIGARTNSPMPLINSQTHFLHESVLLPFGQHVLIVKW